MGPAGTWQLVAAGSQDPVDCEPVKPDCMGQKENTRLPLTTGKGSRHHKLLPVEPVDNKLQWAAKADVSSSIDLGSGKLGTSPEGIGN